MNFNDTIQVKLGNSAEIDLIKLGNGPVIYERLPLYVPYEFKQRSDIEHVKTMVNKTHTDLSYMFYGSYNLLSVTTRNWDTSNVTTMKSMFEGSCIGSWGLDLSKWDTGNVTDMSYMFSRCLLTSLDITHLDISKVTDMRGMLSGNLFRTFDISNWDLSKVTYMSGMFSDCSNLQEIDLSNCTNSDINTIFYGCPKLSSVNLSNYNFEMFFNDKNYLTLFNGAYNLKTLHLDNCNKNTISLIMSAGANPTGLVGEETRKIYCKQSEVPDEPLLSTLLNHGWEFIYIETPEEPIEPYLYRTYDYAYHDTITEVNTIVNESHTSLDHMFYKCNNLVSVNTIEWGTSNVTDMSQMFYRCANLTSLNLNSFDTSNVTKMNSMFSNCSNLTSLDLSSFDTSNVTNMNYIFNSCSNLAELHLSGWDMSKVTDTSSMFYGCKKLYALDLFDCSTDTISKIITSAGFPTGTINKVTRKIYCQRANTAGLTAPNGWEFVDATPYKVGEFANNTEITEVETIVKNTHTDLSNMFYWCSNLTAVNTTDWNTSKVTTMANMFYRCIKLTSLDLDNFDTSNVTDMSGMFEACDLLNTLGMANFDTSKVTNMRNMFHNCHSLTSLDLSHFDTSKVENMSKMFDSCDSLQTLNLSGWDMTNVTNVENMFNGCSSLHTIRLENCSYDTISKIITSSNLPTETINGATRKIYCQEANMTGLTAPDGWEFVYDTPYEVGKYAGNKEITEVITYIDNTHTDLSNMFYWCSNLTTVNTTDWDTSNVTTMANMFSSCRSLTTLDLSSFDTSNVTNMSQMFFNCDLLNTLRIENFDTGKVTNMYQMFFNCDNLTELDLSKWNTGNVTNMDSMFCSCESLTSLDVSSFDTSKITNMHQMFSSCYELRSLDLSSFDTSNVTAMQRTFNCCEKLEILDLRNFDMSKVTDTQRMFDDCNRLYVLRLDNCSNDTINKIITSVGFPKETIEGVTRTIYCKEENAAGLTAPTNWVFSYVD